jgi:serine/threonine protein kinase
MLVLTVIQKHCREIIYWHNLDHPNVLSFLGLAGERETELADVYLVSPWMDNGNMLEFIKRNNSSITELNRLVSAFLSVWYHCTRLMNGKPCSSQLSEAARGLAYLHSQSIVHGDLRCVRTLIMESSSSIDNHSFSLEQYSD